MQIHELKVSVKKSGKRIGRGGKRGTYSGRGMKGQKARSGGNVDPLFEGGRTSLIQKLKKKRGFKAIKPKKHVFNLDVIERKFSDGDEITLSSFVKKGLVKKSEIKKGVKILGNGELKKKLVIGDDVLFSKTAIKAINDINGKVKVGAKVAREKLKKKDK